MTYEFWIEAEKFLYDSILGHMLILGPIFIILATMSLSMIGNKKKKTKIIFFTILLVFIGLGTNTVMKFNKYKVLYDYDVYVNYGIRDRKKIIIMYDYPPVDERRLYEQLYLVDNYRKLPFYKEEIITEEVDFIGRDGDKFYFQDRDQISYRQLEENLTIEEGISTPIREGVRFHLIDSNFENIGFKEKSPSIYLLDYKIPKNMENKKFENPEDLKVVEQQERTLGWMNPTTSNRVIKSE